MHFSDVTTSSSILLVECIQRRSVYVITNMTGLLHKYGPPPTWCLTTRRIFQSNNWIGRRCCTRSFLLKSYCSSWSSPAASGPLLPIYMSLILSTSCWVFPDVTARLFSSTVSTSPAPLSTRAFFLSLTRSVSATLSLLYACTLAFPVKVLPMIVLILSRHSSLCGFVAFPCDASAAQPGQPPVCQ